MLITITHLQLRSPWAFFSLANYARKIITQLKSHPDTGFKKRGFWKDHYTMSSWNDREEMLKFVRSGAHLAAMKDASKFAAMVRTLTIEQDKFPNWKEAIAMLDAKGKVLRY